MYAELMSTPDPARQQYVESLFSHLEWSVATPRVLAIGAGAVQDAYHYSEAYGFSRLHIDCIVSQKSFVPHFSVQGPGGSPDKTFLEIYINVEQGAVEYALGAEQTTTSLCQSTPSG